MDGLQVDVITKAGMSILESLITHIYLGGSGKQIAGVCVYILPTLHQFYPVLSLIASV